jgi:hypothetical protein
MEDSKLFEIMALQKQARMASQSCDLSSTRNGLESLMKVLESGLSLPGLEDSDFNARIRESLLNDTLRDVAMELLQCDCKCSKKSIPSQIIERMEGSELDRVAAKFVRRIPLTLEDEQYYANNPDLINQRLRELIF